MELFDTIFELIRYALEGLIIYGIFILIERLRPAEKNQPFKHIFFNLQWFIVSIFLGELIYVIGIEAFADLIKDWLNAPYFNLPLANNLPEKILHILLYLLVVDFFYYWFHRWQHTNSFLWEEHKFHHSDVSLNVTSASRVHWLEGPFVLVFVFIPLGVLFQIEPKELGLIGFIDVLWLQINHLNLRLELGIFKSVIVGPQRHRIHHSFAPEHIDKNFAAFFPIWDILFGTYYPAKKGEFPPTGLTDKHNYNNL
jgi:sterol desaturase/sphingolipid hydroxylase (fatty acid hydroxylase superfamily)